MDIQELSIHLLFIPELKLRALQVFSIHLTKLISFSEIL